MFCLIRSQAFPVPSNQQDQTARLSVVWKDPECSLIHLSYCADIMRAHQINTYVPTHNRATAHFDESTAIENMTRTKIEVGKKRGKLLKNVNSSFINNGQNIIIVMRYESEIFLEKHNCYTLYYRNVLPDTDLDSLIPVESKNSQIQARKQYIC